MMQIEESSKTMLKGIYDQCCPLLKEKAGNLLIKSILSPQTTVTRALMGSAAKCASSDPNVKELETKGLIAPCKPGVYTITAKGIWYIESEYYGLTLDTFLATINNKKFGLEEKAIDEKNKVILFATIATHAFSENSVIEPNKIGEKTFLDLMRASYEGLYKLGRVKTESFDEYISSSKGNSSKTTVAMMMNKINNLPQNTMGLYMSSFGKYRVNIQKDSNIDKEALKNLLKTVFGKIKTEELEQINELCSNISSKYGIYCRSEIDPLFESQVDQIIEECLFEIYIES